MADHEAPCADCGALFSPEDNYCRQCGMYLPATRAIQVSRAETRALSVSRPGLPAPVTRVATAIAIGAALQVGVGLAGKYLARQAAKQALSAAGRKAVKPAPARRQVAADPIPSDIAAISETVLIRRVLIRRR